MSDCRIIKPEELKTMSLSYRCRVDACNRREKESFNMIRHPGWLGVLWSKTYALFLSDHPDTHMDLLKKSNTYTLSFFDPKYKHVLNLSGTKSGDAECDRVK